MGTAILYHGPGARQTVVDEAPRVGRMLVPPIGDGGLGVDEAREIVNLLLSTPVGMDLGVVIIGPLDEANYKAGDVLLKRLEEFNSDVVLPLLWAHDLGGVRPTLRSRCQECWCPAQTKITAREEALVQTAWGILDAALVRDHVAVLELLRGAAKRKDEPEDDQGLSWRSLLLVGLADALATELSDPRRRAIWEQVRRVARWKNPTFTELAAALVGW